MLCESCGSCSACKREQAKYASQNRMGFIFFVCVCVSMCALECVYACIWGPEVRVSASPVLLLQASRLHVRSKHGKHVSD